VPEENRHTPLVGAKYNRQNRTNRLACDAACNQRRSATPAKAVHHQRSLYDCIADSCLYLQRKALALAAVVVTHEARREIPSQLGSTRVKRRQRVDRCGL